MIEVLDSGLQSPEVEPGRGGEGTVSGGSTFFMTINGWMDGWMDGWMNE